MTPISRLMTNLSGSAFKSITFVSHNSLKTFQTDAAGPEESITGWWGVFRKA